MKKFKNFKKCEMKISLDNCEDTEISLAECIGKSGKYKALVIPIEKLIEISKNCKLYFFLHLPD